MTSDSIGQEAPRGCLVLHAKCYGPLKWTGSDKCQIKRRFGEWWEWSTSSTSAAEVELQHLQSRPPASPAAHTPRSQAQSRGLPAVSVPAHRGMGCRRSQPACCHRAGGGAPGRPARQPQHHIRRCRGWPAPFPRGWTAGLPGAAASGRGCQLLTSPAWHHGLLPRPPRPPVPAPPRGARS